MANQNVEPGWEAAIWSRAVHNTDSTLCKRKNPAGIKARKEGRVGELTRACYSPTTGLQFIDPVKKSVTNLLNGLVVGGIYHGIYPVSDPNRSTNPWCYIPMAPLADVTADESVRYPLDRLELEKHVAAMDVEHKKAIGELEEIRNLCRDSCTSDYLKCPIHSRQVKKVFRDFYTSPAPGRWGSYRPSQFRTDIEAMVDEGASIPALMFRVRREGRAHARDALCTIRFNDDPFVREYKETARTMFESTTDTQDIREFLKAKEDECSKLRGELREKIDLRLAACASEEERRAIYEEDACHPQAGDGPVMLTLRLKWKGLFDSGIPYFPDIDSILKKDRDEELRVRRDLHEKLAELQRAKAAHDKAQIAKGEKNISKETLERIHLFARHTRPCVTVGCQNLAVPPSFVQDNVQCGICYTLIKQGVRKSYSYFCNDKCMDGRAFPEHVLKEHQCSAGAACLKVGKRRIDEKVFGTCAHCFYKYGVVSYFCTQECWDKNKADHFNHEHNRLLLALARELADDGAFEAWSKKNGVTDEDLRRASADASSTD